MTFKNGINASKENYGKGYKFINVLDIIASSVITNESIIGAVDISHNVFEKNIVEYGDILFQRSSETREEVGQANVYMDKMTPSTFGGFVIRGKKKSQYDPLYMNYLLKTSSARKEITSKSGGSTRYNVGQDVLGSIKICISSVEEQQRISSFLMRIDTRITTQMEIIKDYERLKKGILQKLIPNDMYGNTLVKKLGDICEITTGKLDANTMDINGKYRFYTCAKKIYRINEYAFDFEALLVSGNGANVGYVHHYKGKFNAYQRTYVLFNLTEDYQFIRYYLDVFLKRRIHREKKDGNTPYIVLQTLSKMNIYLPPLPEQQKTAKTLSALDSKIDIENKLLEQLKLQKQYLLQNLFI